MLIEMLLQPSFVTVMLLSIGQPEGHLVHTMVLLIPKVLGSVLGQVEEVSQQLTQVCLINASANYQVPPA